MASSMTRRSVSSLVILAALASSTSALADNDVRILSGGPSSVTLLAPKKAALDKAAGGTVQITVNPADVAMAAVVKGVADGVISGPLDELLLLAEKRGMPKQNPADFQSTAISEVVIKIGVHPDNPVSALSNDQIRDILSGKTRNWQTLNGQNKAISVLLAKNYVTTETAIMQFYLQKDSSAIVTHVLDKTGLVKAIQKDTGAIGFFTERDSVAGFTPKYLVTEVKRPSLLHMKKQARPAAQKVFDYLKAQGAVRVD
jgi:ABC-type phosphate transport system substrate-binding protein